MILLNQERQLGQRAYLLIASRKMLPGLVILLIAAILFVISSDIDELIRTLLASGTGGTSIVTVVSASVMNIIFALFIVGLIVMLVGIIIARLEYSNYTYTFEEFDLRMRRGIFHRSETSLPYRQIQDIDIDRNLAHQFLGLSKLTIITAGHEETTEYEKVEVILEPLEREVAEDIRIMLERKIGVQVVKTVQEADNEVNTELPKTVPPQNRVL